MRELSSDRRIVYRPKAIDKDRETMAMVHCTEPLAPPTVSRCSTSRKAPMTSTGRHIDFNAPAVLRKWPSLKNERRTVSHGAYLVVDGTLDECIRSFMSKPVSIQHLYEVHTLPQPPLVEPVLSGEILAELARLRDFL